MYCLFLLFSSRRTIYDMTDRPSCAILCDIHDIAGLVPIAMLWTTIMHIFVFENR